MTSQPAPSTDNNPDLFDLAAELAGCAPVDLLKVRREGAALVVILATGQKFVFDGAELAGRIAQALSDDVMPLIDARQPGAPAAAPAATKAHTNGKAVGAGAKK